MMRRAKTRPSAREEKARSTDVIRRVRWLC